jgi:hypothetical protein
MTLPVDNNGIAARGFKESRDWLRKAAEIRHFLWPVSREKGESRGRARIA